MAHRALGPATHALVKAVDSAVEDREAVLVACSGGPDSLALAAATQLVLSRRTHAGSAVVVDHGLQPGSDSIAATARVQLQQLGLVDVLVVKAEVDLSSGLGLEGAAREARYRILDAEAARRGATVLLGHTRDDQAETVLLGLARGSGTRSLAGMAIRTGRYLRPMLSLSRAASEQVCTELGLAPWHDPHNVDDSYARARVRKRVLPVLETELGPGITESLARTAQLARDDADLLDRLAAEAHPDTDTLDCGALRNLAAALRSRIIRSWLRRCGAAEATLAHVLAVDALITQWHGQQGVDLAGVRVSRVQGCLVCTSNG